MWVTAAAPCSGKPAAPDLPAATSLPKVRGRKPLAGGTVRSNGMPDRPCGQACLGCGWVTVPATGSGSSVAGALTIRSSRNRFAVRLNSSVIRGHAASSWRLHSAARLLISPAPVLLAFGQHHSGSLSTLRCGSLLLVRVAPHATCRIAQPSRRRRRLRPCVATHCPGWRWQSLGSLVTRSCQCARASALSVAV